MAYVLRVAPLSLSSRRARTDPAVRERERQWRDLALPAISLEFSPVAATSPRGSPQRVRLNAYDHPDRQPPRERLFRLSPLRHAPAHSLAAMGTGSLRPGEKGGQAHPARHRRRLVSLVSRHGPRVL